MVEYLEGIVFFVSSIQGALRDGQLLTQHHEGLAFFIMADVLVLSSAGYGVGIASASLLMMRLLYTNRIGKRDSLLYNTKLMSKRLCYMKVSAKIERL